MVERNVRTASQTANLKCGEQERLEALLTTLKSRAKTPLVDMERLEKYLDFHKIDIRSFSRASLNTFGVLIIAHFVLN